MESRRLIAIALIMSMILISACKPYDKNPSDKNPIKNLPIGAATGQVDPSTTGTNEQIRTDTRQQTAQEKAQTNAATNPQASSTANADSAPVQAAIEPDSGLEPNSGLKTLKLAPAGDATEDELVKAMALLQVELGVKPELKVKQISRTGKGKDARILVSTELSSTKPIIAIVNAIKNRERFEGKIGDKTLFNNNDLRFVCRLPICAAVEDMSECPAVTGGYACAWTFGIVIWESAGQRVADAAKGLTAHLDGTEMVVDTPINLYLNGKLLDYVYIPANMTNAPITDMSITGNATAPSQKEAQKKAAAEMDKIRDTMSRKLLPIELNILE